MAADQGGMWLPDFRKWHGTDITAVPNDSAFGGRADIHWTLQNVRWWPEPDL